MALLIGVKWKLWAMSPHTRQEAKVSKSKASKSPVVAKQLAAAQPTAATQPTAAQNLKQLKERMNQPDAKALASYLRELGETHRGVNFPLQDLGNGGVLCLDPEGLVIREVPDFNDFEPKLGYHGLTNFFGKTAPELAYIDWSKVNARLAEGHALAKKAGKYNVPAEFGQRAISFMMHDSRVGLETPRSIFFNSIGD